MDMEIEMRIELLKIEIDIYKMYEIKSYKSLLWKMDRLSEREERVFGYCSEIEFFRRRLDELYEQRNRIFNEICHDKNW